MTKFWRLAAAMLAFAWANAPAMAAEHIECVDSGYSVADQEVFDAYIDDFSLDDWGQNGVPNNIVETITKRVRACATRHGWSADAMQDAFSYKVAGIGLLGIQNASYLSAEDFARLDSALTEDDEIEAAKNLDAIAKAREEGRPDEAPMRSIKMRVDQLFERSGVRSSYDYGGSVAMWLESKVRLNQSLARFVRR